MSNVLSWLTSVTPSARQYHISILLFRVAISLEIMVVHGLKKIGVGVGRPEDIPNPLHLNTSVNEIFAVSANLFFPLLVILGLLTRVSVLLILSVTLTGYFVVHWNDSLLEKDVPFVYSLC